MTTEGTQSGAAGFYPGSTALSDQVSVFLLGFRHAVSERVFEPWAGRLRRLGWVTHPYTLDRPCRGADHNERAFKPHFVLTPVAERTIFGQTRPDGDSDEARSTGVLRDRLSPRRGALKHTENLLLTRDPSRCDWLRRSLEAVDPDGRVFRFKIDWADLWLFDDECGVVAFKVTLERAVPSAGMSGERCLSDLSRLHRHLRDWHDPRVTVRRAEEQNEPRRLWHDIILGESLGALEPGGHLLMRDAEPPESVFDCSSRYSKVLTGVHLPAPASDEEDFAWSSPLADPLPGYAYRHHFDALRRGDWGPEMLAFQAASIAGYPSYRDLFLFELATTSDEGAAAGYNGKGWQYSVEYVRKLFDQGGIEIWDCWAGLAVRDLCAFVAWDDSMPLLKSEQLEAFYYPLYVHAYHLRLELDDIATNCVDHDLVDSRRLRAQLRRFETFRSRYWFKEVTRDFQGVEVFQQMKAGMKIDDLFAAVSEEVREVGDYLERMVERGRQALITLLIVAAYPIYVWYKDAAEHTWIGRVLERYEAFNSDNPAAAFAVALFVIILLFLLVGVVWTRAAPLVAKVVQRIYAYLERHRPW